MMMMMIYCVGSGCTRWFYFANTNTPNSLQVLATTLEACQAACSVNTLCTGIDWTASGTQCRLTIPSSGLKNVGGASGTNHYDLIRDCEVAGNNDGRNLQC